MAGHKTWAVGEEALAADINGALADQVVAQFPTVAARDAGWTTPPKGATCITIDTLSVWQYDGAAWVQFMAPGTQRLVSEYVHTGDSGNVGNSNVSVPGFPRTFTPLAGREYYARFACRIAVSAAQAGVIMTLNGPPGVGGTAYSQWEGYGQASYWLQAESKLLGLPTGAPYTLSLVARCLTSGQYVVLTGATARPGTLQIWERLP